MSDLGPKTVFYESKIHGKTEYVIGLADGEDGSEMAIQLNAMIAPSFAHAIPKNLFDDDGTAEFNMADIIKNSDGLSKALEMISMKLQGAENKKLRHDLLKLVTFKTSNSNGFQSVHEKMKTHFQKNYGALGFLLIETIKHNDFLDLSLSSLKSLFGSETEEQASTEAQ